MTGLIVHHPRKTWEDPRYPVTGPAMSWTHIVGTAIHYTAANNLIDGDLGEFATNLPAYMRAIQRDYLNRQPTGYSIGYNFAVDWLGGVWECRGFDIKCAAHAPLNEEYNAILMLVDGADRCTELAAESVRRIVEQFEIRAKRQLTIYGHGKLPDGNPTACPGKGLLAQIDEGLFSPRWQPPAPPVTDDPEVAMLIKDHDDPAVWLSYWIGTRRYRTHVMAEEFDALVAQVGPLIILPVGQSVTEFGTVVGG